MAGGGLPAWRVHPCRCCSDESFARFAVILICSSSGLKVRRQFLQGFRCAVR